MIPRHLHNPAKRMIRLCLNYHPHSGGILYSCQTKKFVNRCTSSYAYNMAIGLIVYSEIDVRNSLGSSSVDYDKVHLNDITVWLSLFRFQICQTSVERVHMFIFREALNVKEGFEVSRYAIKHIFISFRCLVVRISAGCNNYVFPEVAQKYRGDRNLVRDETLKLICTLNYEIGLRVLKSLNLNMHIKTSHC